MKKLNKLKIQLDRLNSIGGLDPIVPSEGIVFKYKGKTYKFTADLHQSIKYRFNDILGVGYE